MTTLNEDGSVNIAPMGPIVDEAMSTLVLRPFQTSTTYRNLKANGEGVFHVTDDVLLLARGAVRKLDDAPMRDAEQVKGKVLAEACRAYEFKAVALDDSQDRTKIDCQIVHTINLRPFFGFNRAKHGVLEAAILATRLHLTGKAPVLAEFEKLQIMVDKTGGPAEHQAMKELWDFVREAKLD